MYLTVRSVAVAATALCLLAGTAPVSQADAQRPEPAENAVRVATYNVMKTTRMRSEVALEQAPRCPGQDGGGRVAGRPRGAGGEHPAMARPMHITDVRQSLDGTRLSDRVRGLLALHVGVHAGCAHLLQDISDGLGGNPLGPAAGGDVGRMSTIADVGFGGTQDRNASWAFLTPLGSARTTLFISVHLPTEKTRNGRAAAGGCGQATAPVGRRAHRTQRLVGRGHRHRRRLQLLRTTAAARCPERACQVGSDRRLQRARRRSTRTVPPSTTRREPASTGGSRRGRTATVGTRPASTTSSRPWHHCAMRSCCTSLTGVGSTTATARRTTTWCWWTCHCADRRAGVSVSGGDRGRRARGRRGSPPTRESRRGRRPPRGCDGCRPAPVGPRRGPDR